MTTLFRRYLTLFMSTLKYTTLFQRWFDIGPRRDVASTKRQRWNNVEMFAGWYFLKTKENIKLNRKWAVKLTLSSIENEQWS